MKQAIIIIIGVVVLICFWIWAEQCWNVQTTTTQNSLKCTPVIYNPNNQSVSGGGCTTTKVIVPVSQLRCNMDWEQTKLIYSGIIIISTIGLTIAVSFLVRDKKKKK